MRVVVLTPDLGDRSKIAAALPDAVFVGVAAALPGTVEEGDVVVVDLSRPGVLDVLGEVMATAARVVGYGPHVDTALLAAADAAGARAVPRSRFFANVGSAVSVHD